MTSSSEEIRSSRSSLDPLSEPPDQASRPDTESKETSIFEFPAAPDPTHSKNANDRDTPAEPKIEQKQPDDAIAKEEYTVFTINQKRAMIVAASLCGWFSPMSSSIYYPATTQIASDLRVSSSQINLTVTTYLIIQGLAPMMIAGFSDKAGRRPAYFICFVIYMIANLALALQNSYVALLILRMLQSAGSSGTIALANGLVGDCVVSADRGQYIAFASLGSILGPTLSPILGGLLSQYLDWHWIFWFLLILSAAFFIPLMLFLPETCRSIVGDGSIPPPWSSWNISDYYRHKHRVAKGIQVDEEKIKKLRKNYKITIPNPVSTLVVLSDFETALLLLATGLALACFYAISTGASESFSTLYGFDELHVSLMFLPIGGGSLLSAFTTGYLLDWNYRRHAHRLNFPVHKNRQTDLSTFPIELARMQIALPLFFLGATTIILYGWLLPLTLPLAVPIILLFLLGYTLIAGFQCLNVLMVDIYPGQPATATAANNVVRCLLGAAASAAIGPMSERMGDGGAYTLLAGLFLLSSAGPVVSMWRGVEWRGKRREREERKKRAKEEEGKERREGDEGKKGWRGLRVWRRQS